MVEEAVTVRAFHSMLLHEGDGLVISNGGCQPRTCSWWVETWDVTSLGPLPDAGIVRPDAGPRVDAGPRRDAGTPGRDAGSSTGGTPGGGGGCGCGVVPPASGPAAWALAALVWLGIRRRRR